MKAFWQEHEVAVISALGVFATFGLLWCVYLALLWFDAKLGAL